MPESNARMILGAGELSDYLKETSDVFLQVYAAQARPLKIQPE